VRSNVSNNFLLGALFILAMSSVGLKAAAGAPDSGGGDGRSGQLENQIIGDLRAQGFSTALSPRVIQSSIVYAERGDCRLSVRNASQGASTVAIFAREAQSIGPVRYLYNGNAYDAPPAFAMRVDQFENELLHRVNLHRNIAVPVAVATSPGCRGNNFGLEDVRITD
jgi:hypothetical protein